MVTHKQWEPMSDGDPQAIVTHKQQQPMSDGNGDGDPRATVMAAATCE